MANKLFVHSWQTIIRAFVANKLFVHSWQTNYSCIRGKQIIRAWLLNEVEAIVAKNNFSHKFLLDNNMQVINRELVNDAGYKKDGKLKQHSGY